MSLLNPLLFALGAAALLIPLWVHLRLGKVKKRARVGSLLLLRTSPQTSRSPRRLVNRPLFLLRCLVLLLLALGFGRLLVPGLGKEQTFESAAFVLDVSGSMQAKNGARTCWDVAQEAALKYLDLLAPSARVALFLSPPTGDQPGWGPPAAARNAIRKLKPGFAANQLGTDILAAVAALQTMPNDQPKNLNVFSDFQLSSLAQIDQIAIPQGIQIQLTKASPDRPANRGVTVAVTQAGASNLRLYGFNDGTPGTLQLCENNATNSASIAAGQLVPGQTPAPGPDGCISRKLRYSESDDLAADACAYDLFRPQAEIPVWLWDSPAAQHAKTIMEAPTYFLSCALQPMEKSPVTVSRFRPRSVSGNSLYDTNLPPLLLIIAAEEYPPELVAAAGAIVTNGGSVIFFGGKALTAKALEAFGALAPVVPEGIQDIPFRPALAPINPDHPLFGGLGAPERLRLAASPLFKRHTLTLKPAARILAQFADDKPFIVQADAAAGKVYFVNTSADREFGDWPADAPRFVPAIHLLAAHAVENKFPRPDDAPFLVGQPRALLLDCGLAGKTVLIDGVNHLVAADGTVTNVMFADPGEKAVLLDTQAVCRVAVNFPPSESALDNLSEAVLRQRLESQRQHGSGVSVRWETGSAGQLAWQLSLLVGSVLLLIEPLIAGRNSSR